MSLNFCCDIQMVGSEFGAKYMKAWIYPEYFRFATNHGASFTEEMRMIIACN